MLNDLNLRVCWIGGTRYTQPLDATQAKKWRLLRDELGIEIFVISLAGSWRPKTFTEHAHFYLLPALPLALLRYATMYALCPLLLLWLIARRGVRIVVAHDPYFGLIGAVAKGIARLIGVRVALVIESHADFEAVFLQRRMPLAGVIRQLMRWTTRQSLRQADVLRAVSSNTRQQLMALASKPVFQFLTWTDLDTFSATPREFLPSQTHDLVYVGVLIPRKGVHLLLEAFADAGANFPDSHLWLVGSADNPAYAESLVQQVEKLDLTERVTFVGRVPQAELARYLGRSRALVLPSSSEGLPRVIIEAMIAAMPVVATCVAGIPDVVSKGVNGYLVPPEDAPALTKALRAVLENPDVDQMGQKGHELATKLFSSSAYVAGYADVLRAAGAVVQ